MTDFADLTDQRLNIVVELAAGNGEPLARWLENGGDLKDDQRAVLIKYLRKELTLKRGNRRTFSDDVKIRKMRTTLQNLQREFAIKFGSYRSYSRALDAYHAMHPDVPFESIRKIAKRGLLSKAYLDAIDQAREASES